MLYNPFTVVFCLLMLLSAAWAVRCLVRRKQILLPSWLCLGWFGTLGLAWCAKFLIGPKYW